MNQIIYLVPALGILGLVVMAVKSAWVSKQDAGDKNMQELAGYIADGAMAFLKAEWKVLSIFVVIAAALLAYSGTIHEVNGIQIHGQVGSFLLHLLLVQFFLQRQVI
jgi:K(+)-stimulated pyrophosphate-energized sodium pump